MVGAEPSWRTAFFWVELVSILLLLESVLAEDRDIILNARRVLDPGGNRLRSWAMTDELCNSSTTGIRCNGQGRVTTLVLPFESLTGTIPPSFGLLTALERLVLNGNELHGLIPAEIGKLTSLVELRLSSNKLSGEIPRELSLLENLASLHLDHNDLIGHVPQELGWLVRNPGETLDQVLVLPKDKADGKTRYIRRGCETAAASVHPREGKAQGHLRVLRVDGNRLTGPIPKGFLHLGEGFSYKGNKGLCGAGFADLSPCDCAVLPQRARDNSALLPSQSEQKTAPVKLPEPPRSVNYYLLMLLRFGIRWPMKGHQSQRQEKQQEHGLRWLTRSLSASGGLLPPHRTKKGRIMHRQIRELNNGPGYGDSHIQRASLSASVPHPHESKTGLGTASLASPVSPVAGGESLELKAGDTTVRETPAMPSGQPNVFQNSSTGGAQLSLLSGVGAGVVVCFLGMIGIVFAVMRVGKRRREGHLLKELSRSMKNSTPGKGLKGTKGSTVVPHKKSLMVAAGVGPLTPLQWLRGSSCTTKDGGDTTDFSHLSGWGKWYRLQELMAATNNFSDKRILGKGGHGTVYLGILKDRSKIAVKDLNVAKGQGEMEWLSEIDAISRVHHQHLMKLRGCCAEAWRKVLVYDYMANGTLEDQLHGCDEALRVSLHQPSTRPAILSWENRFKIVMGAAKGLAYLHEVVHPRMIHRDIKASNILLDEEFNAKLSDFGLARTVPEGENHLTTKNIAGTLGYLAPEYAVIGRLTDKSDVYSFGVLLLEVVTGRRPIGQSADGAALNIVQWVKPLFERGCLQRLVDPRLRGRYPEWEVRTTIRVALACVNEISSSRPAMSKVVSILELSHAASVDVVNLQLMPSSGKRDREGHAVRASKDDVFEDARSFLPSVSKSSSEFELSPQTSSAGEKDLEAGVMSPPERLEFRFVAKRNEESPAKSGVSPFLKSTVNPTRAKEDRDGKDVGIKLSSEKLSIVCVTTTASEKLSSAPPTSSAATSELSFSTSRKQSAKPMSAAKEWRSRSSLTVDVKNSKGKKNGGAKEAKSESKKLPSFKRKEKVVEEEEEVIDHNSDFYPSFEGIQTPPPLSNKFFLDQWDVQDVDAGPVPSGPVGK